MSLSVEAPTRTCNRCGKTQPEENFHRARTGFADVNGIKRRSVCASCIRKHRIQVENEGPVAHRLDAGPFVAWLKERQQTYMALHEDASQEDFAHSVGVPERRVFDLLAGRQHVVALTTVDRALTWEGSTFLWELYPDLYPGLDASRMSDLLRESA